MANITPLSTLPTERAQTMLSRLLMWSNWFSFIERRSGFELAATDFDLYPDGDEGPGAQKRGVGSGYTKRSQTPPSRESETLGFHGDRVALDRSHIRDNELGIRPIGAWLPTRLRNRYRGSVKDWEKLAFRGSGVDDGTGRETKGILTLLDGSNVPGFNVSMVIDAADFVSASVNSLDMSDPAHREALRKALEQILPNYEDAGIACNRQLASVITGIAEENTKYNRTREEIWGMVERVFGNELIRLFDGVITNSEPDNAGTPNNNTTSMVIASPEEGGYSVATNSGLYVKDTIDDVSEDDDDAEREVEWEMRFENAVQQKYNLLRIRNIKVAPGTESYGFFGA